MGKYNRKNKRYSSRGETMTKVVNQITAGKPSTTVTQGFDIATRQNSFDFSSFLGSLPNPDPVLKRLGNDVQVYEDLRYDSRVSAVVGSRKSAVASMEWRVKGDDQVAVDFYTELFKSYPMHDTITEILDAPLFGYKPIEIMWEAMDGKLIPIHFIGKPPRWFRYDDENKLHFLSATNYTTGILVPDNKFIVARHNPTYDNPYGQPVLSGCFWPVTFRKTGLKYWTIFLEKYGMPFLLGKAPEGAKEAEIQAVADLLQNMVQDAIAVVPSEYEISIEESSGGKGKTDSIHKTYLDFMDMEIAMAVVGTNLTTEVESGSFAASKSHMEVRADIIDSDKVIVEQAFNELITITHKLNFASIEIPVFELYKEKEVSETRSKRDLNLKGTGVKFKKTYFEKNYSLQDEDFEMDENVTITST